jgi:ATP-dependent Clp protease ATP-binding subunit ClpA
MFERYTERARRVVFFSRYEAAQLGSNSIETEHLLLGLIREASKPISQLFREKEILPNSFRKEIEERTVRGDGGSTSVDIPLSEESKRALGYAEAEAEVMLHDDIDTWHLLLGLMRCEGSLAAGILAEKGLKVSAVRKDLVRLLQKASPGTQRGGEPPKIGDIVHFHLNTDQGLLTMPAIITGIHNGATVSLIAFHPTEGCQQKHEVGHSKIGTKHGSWTRIPIE